MAIVATATANSKSKAKTFSRDNWSVVPVNELKILHPAFLSLRPGVNETGSTDLLVSSFGLIGRDHIYSVRNIEAIFDYAKPHAKVITHDIVWPNEVQYLDRSIWGKEGYLVTSGFLMPTKTTGAVSFLDAVTGVVTELTRRKFDYFYHRAEFVDVTGTGRQDIITARSKIPTVFGEPDGELVWLQRPRNPISRNWPEVVLAKGPDIHFRVFRDKGSADVMIVTAEFSKKQLSLYWLDASGGIKSRVIDRAMGAPFDLNFYDLNNDGRDELLVTNHQNDESASVFAYETPEDLRTGKWQRHTLLTGIETLQPGIGQASPGVAKAFVPQAKLAGIEKPWVLVSGDGSQRAHLLVPDSNFANDWQYTEHIILDTKSTVGEPLIRDFNNDGWADFIIPAYDTNLLYFMSLRDH